MRKKHKVLIAVLSIIVMAVIAFVFIDRYADQRRWAARARFEWPEGFEHYASPGASGHPAPNPSAAPPESVQRFKPLLDLGANLTWRDPAFLPEFEGLVATPMADWPDGGAERLREFISDNQSYIHAIRDAAALGGPVSTEVLDERAAMPHHTTLEWLASHLLKADACIAALDHDAGRVVDDVVAMEQLGEALVPESNFFAQGMRMFIARTAFDSMYLLPTVLPRDDAQRLIDGLSRADHRDAYAASLGSEAALGLAHFDDLGNLQDVLGGRGMFEYFMLNGYGALYMSLPARPLRRLDEAMYLDRMAEVCEMARLPAYEASVEFQPLITNIHETRVTHLVPWLLLRSWGQANVPQARHEAMLDLAQLGIAIERFRSNTGKLPRSLDELADRIPGGTAVDPFTGLPYIYRPTGDTFLLYSVGSNMRDDGGHHDHLNGDTVWRGAPKSDS